MIEVKHVKSYMDHESMTNKIGICVSISHEDIEKELPSELSRRIADIMTDSILDYKLHGDEHVL